MIASPSACGHLIDRWDRDRAELPGASRIILTHTNDEVRELNLAARERHPEEIRIIAVTPPAVAARNVEETQRVVKSLAGAACGRGSAPARFALTPFVAKSLALALSAAEGGSQSKV